MLVPPTAEGALLCLRHFLTDVLQSHHVRFCDAHSKNPLNISGPQFAGLWDGTRLCGSGQQISNCQGRRASAGTWQLSGKRSYV